MRKEFVEKETWHKIKLCSYCFRDRGVKFMPISQEKLQNKRAE